MNERNETILTLDGFCNDGAMLVLYNVVGVDLAGVAMP